VDTWRETINKGGMNAWSDALMSMRFADGDVDPKMYEWVRHLQKQCSPTAVYEQAEFIKTQDLTSELDNIRAPILILAPDGSPFVNRSLAEDLHAQLKASEIQWFPGQRHSLLLSRAQDCAAAYVNFMKRRT
jgi:pimeloyl-ACP methyl ester carboxylesterase